MKKTIKNSSKRKWIVGGVAFFGAVALLTTGFATWVIGVNQDKDSETVSVTVDTTRNDSLYLETTLDSSNNTILLEETQTGGDGSVIKIEDGAEAEDLHVAVDCKLTVGSNVTVTGILFKIEPAITGTDLLTNSNLGFDVTGKTRSTLNYLDLKDEEGRYAQEYLYEFEEGKTDVTEDTTHVVLNFYWGGFFDNKTPSTFYNGLTYGTGSAAEKAKATEQIQAELEAMKGAFESGITITATAQVQDGE